MINAQASEADIKRMAGWGVGAAIAVTAVSAAANVYTAAHHAVEAFGGWDELGFEGWLTLGLNAGIACGAEALGFLGLAFALSFALERAWIRAAAAAAVFAVCLVTNVMNTHAFGALQAEGEALHAAQARPEYQAALAAIATADASLADLNAQGGMSAAALRAQIAGLQRDREAAREAGRYVEARSFANDIKAARTQLAAAESREEAIAKGEGEKEAAQATIAALTAAAQPTAAAQARAAIVTVAVEVVKALGLLAFTVGEMKRPAPKQAPAQETAQDGRVAASPRSRASEPGGCGKRTSYRVPPLTAEQRRARQREYTRRWRAKVAAAAAG